MCDCLLSYWTKKNWSYYISIIKNGLTYDTASLNKRSDLQPWELITLSFINTLKFHNKDPWPLGWILCLSFPIKPLLSFSSTLLAPEADAYGFCKWTPLPSGFHWWLLTGNFLLMEEKEQSKIDWLIPVPFLQGSCGLTIPLKHQPQLLSGTCLPFCL